MNGNGISFDPFEEDKAQSYRKYAIWGGMLAYLSAIVLTISHNYNLIVGNSVAEAVRWIAVVGFIGLEINAVALPLAIHFWTVTRGHKTTATIFYAIDILLLYANSLIDTKIVSGAVMPAWGDWYLTNVAQVSPIFTMIVWAVLFAQDPSQNAKERLRALAAKANETALMQVNEWFASPDFAKRIATRGDQIGDYVLRMAFQNKHIFSGELKDEPKEQVDVFEESPVLATKSLNGRGGDKEGKSPRVNF